MRPSSLRAAVLALALGSPAVASVIDLSLLPSTEQIISGVDELLHPHREVLGVEHTYDTKTSSYRKVCTLKALGNELDDADNLVKAVEECGNGGVLRLPDANYTIGKALQLELHNAYVDLHGWLSFTTDTDYWIKNRIPFEFQKQSLGFVIRGTDYVLDGNDKGGINGNGQVWYNLAKDAGNFYGRPMSLAIVDSKNVIVKNWSVVQPQFWASITINSENVLIKDFYVNATSFDPASKVDEKNWLQNTDGLDTYRSHNVTVENMVYQGGDDCIALKPNSTMINIRNVTCFGGTGIAFGSIAQYEGVLDIIEDVVMDDIQLYPSTQCPGYQGVYFKSWVGESSGTPPNGGGGGFGYCRNVTVKNVHMENILHPIAVDTDLIYTLGEKGKQTNNGKFEWYDIHLSNFTGQAAWNRVAWMDCSKTRPCHDWTFDAIDIKPGKTDHPEIGYVCNNFVLGGNDGLNRCHPSNSTLETDNGGTL